jgi:polyhydroxybutyrate depolymerase
MRRLAALLLAPLAAILPAPPSGAAPGAASGPAPGTTEHRLAFGGLDRSYQVVIPPGLSKKPAAVVVVLHGGFGTAEGALRQGGWVEAAARGRFVAVAPEGVIRSWNAGECCGPPARRGVDDVGFVLAVLDEVEGDLRVDRDRVFATGISNGGMLAYRLACDAADRFAAIAPVAATVVTDGCDPRVPVSVLHVHGLADENVPFEGGVPTRSFQADPPAYRPVRESLDVFVRADGCTATPRVRTRGAVTTERWRGCTDRSAVELVTIADGGHSWPGGQQMARVLDPPSTALDATAAIVDFFAAHPRTG